MAHKRVLEWFSLLRRNTEEKHIKSCIGRCDFVVFSRRIVYIGICCQACVRRFLLETRLAHLAHHGYINRSDKDNVYFARSGPRTMPQYVPTYPMIQNTAGIDLWQWFVMRVVLRKLRSLLCADVADTIRQMICSVIHAGVEVTSYQPANFTVILARPVHDQV